MKNEDYTNLDVLVLSGVRRSEDSTNHDSVLVDEVDGRFRIDDIALGGTVPVTFLDFEIPCCFFPADLNSGVHDDVGLIPGLSFSLALI